ncbi:MAG: hypothetical protein L6R37_003881 [Teloschistes peruensis]|nr:MAG: hypothetical protein L6R37_003881 [Teloschistes peruensis]
MRSFRLSSFLALVAFLLALAGQVLITLAVHWGLGRHMEGLNHEEIRMTMTYIWQAQPIQLLANTAGKVSIAALLVTLHGPKFAKSKTIFIWTLAAISTIFVIIAISRKSSKHDLVVRLSNLPSSQSKAYATISNNNNRTHSDSTENFFKNINSGQIIKTTEVNMATLIPPPSKRQRVAVAEKAREQQDIDTIPGHLGSVRVHFFDQSTGKPTGAPVAIPVADATVKNLELLLNTLQGNDATERVPYRFTFAADGKHLDIANDIYRTLLRPGLKTTEDTITLQYTPQAIFRVRAVSRCSAAIPGHGEAILATSFASSSSSRLATGSGDSTARIFDTDTGTPLHTLKGHTSWVLVASWSPDDTTIATGSMDNTVRLWDPKTGQCLGQPLTGHTKWVNSLAWEPYHLRKEKTSIRLASSSKDATVRIWDTVSKRIDLVLSGHKSSVSCVRWGGTGTIYTASHDKTIKLWDSTKGTLISTLSAHAHWVNHLALSTELVLRTAYHDPTPSTTTTTTIIPTTDAEKLAKAKSRFEKAATTDGRIVERFVTASDDLTIYLWSPTESPSKPLARLHGHAKPVSHVTFSPSGQYIASASFDNHIKIWSARDGAFIHTLRGHVGAVYMTCFSPDSRLLVSCSRDTTVKVWEVGRGVLREDLVGHRDEVFAVDWSPDGRGVGSGGKDRAVRVWRH